MRPWLAGCAIIGMLGTGWGVAAPPQSGKAQLKALARGCSAAALYDLKGLEAGLTSSVASADWFSGATGSTRGDLRDPAPADASVVLRGVIGASMMQSTPYSTATTIWRDADGVWQVSQVDHATALPPPPPVPPPYPPKPGSEEGTSLVQIKPLPDVSRRETRGRLSPAMAAKLNTLLADPCFALEMAGLAAQPLKRKGAATCPADYAGSTMEVMVDGRRRYVTTDCQGTLPSAAIANIVFYPQTDTVSASWPAPQPCPDCYREYPFPASYALHERSGDTAVDQAITQFYAAYDRKDYAGALAIAKTVVDSDSPVRWVMMPMLARMQLLTGALDDAALTSGTAEKLLSFLKAPSNCDNWAVRKAKYTYWPKWIRSLEAQSAVCETNLIHASKDGVDAETLELIGVKAGAVSQRIYDAIRDRETIRLGHPPQYPDD